MKRTIITALMTGLFSIGALAQEPYFIKLEKNEIFADGQYVTVEELEETVSTVENDYIVVITDTDSQAIHLPAIKQAVERVTTADITFFTPFEREPWQNYRHFERVNIGLARSIMFPALSNEDYYSEEFLSDKEIGEIPTFTIEGKTILYKGEPTNMATAANRISGTDTDNYSPLVIVRVKGDTSIRDLYNFYDYISREIEYFGKADKIQVLYAFPDSRICDAVNLGIVSADPVEYVCKVVNYNKSDLSVLPTYDEHEVKDFGREVVTSWMKYPEESKGFQGRVFVNFTIGVDGTVKDVEYIQGPEILREAVITAITTMPARWHYGVERSSNQPVDVRVTNLPVFVQAPRY